MNGSVIFENRVDEEKTPAIGGNSTPFTHSIERLIKKYQEIFLPRLRGDMATIHVDEIASKIAHFYERVRKIIDWKEENLLRRNAIERILKRSLIAEISNLEFLFKTDVDGLAEPLVLELIRGGHLPNDEIPETKIIEVQKVIKKYLYFFKNAPFGKEDASFALKKKVNFYDWLLEIAACEIEEVLAPPLKENALIESMTAAMNERIRVLPAGRLGEEEKIIQTYVAVHRTLFDLDDAIISYHLLKYHYPQWVNPSEEFIKETAERIFLVEEEINKDLNHPLAREFFNICERTDTVFTLISDGLELLKEQPDKIPGVFADRQTLQTLLDKCYEKRYRTLKSRLFKLAIFSTLSVFVSNWFTFFIIEVPMAHFFYEGFNVFAAAVDFLLPSLAMFILVAMIKPPPASNQKKAVELVFGFAYRTGDKEIYEIKPRKNRGWLTRIIIAVFYLSAACFFFGMVAWGFYKAKIPVTSVIFDTLTIAINVFAALVIRNKSREITVEEKTSFWEFLLDILSVPVAQFGSFFANKWKEYNVVSVFFNVVIEMPFVSLIGFIEDWRNFLKERKAEIH